MASSCFPFSILVNVGLVIIFVLSTWGCSAYYLSTDFYSKSCPKLLSTVKPIVQSAVATDRFMGAGLLRLHFHDCFVHGCDASILLNDTSSFKGEKTATPNHNSVRGYEVIDQIKSKVEQVCPGVVSCADIVAIAARDSTVILGGPSWDVKLGRRDAKTTSFAAANNSGDLPSATSTIGDLIKTFKAKGLSVKEIVALSGAHTIGQARCINFRDRIYSDSNIKSSFTKKRKASCPQNSGDNNLAPLDVQSPLVFDNKYYKNLLKKKGLLHSDQVLFNGDSTDSLVRHYSKNRTSFYSDFAAAMIKMGDISPLTGSSGEIRKNCGKPN